MWATAATFFFSKFYFCFNSMISFGQTDTMQFNVVSTTNDRTEDSRNAHIVCTRETTTTTTRMKCLVSKTKKKGIFVCSRNFFGEERVFLLAIQSISNRLLDRSCWSRIKNTRIRHNHAFSQTLLPSHQRQMRYVSKWPSNSYVWLMTRRCSQWIRLALKWLRVLHLFRFPNWALAPADTRA